MFKIYSFDSKDSLPTRQPNGQASWTPTIASAKKGAYSKNVDTFSIVLLKLAFFFNSLCVWIWLMITWLYFGITVSICPCVYLCCPCLQDLSRGYVLNHSTFCNQTLYSCASSWADMIQVTGIAGERSWSFYPVCRWQVTTKHTCILVCGFK